MTSKKKRLCKRCKQRERPVGQGYRYCDQCKDLAWAERYLKQLAREKLRKKNPEDREKWNARARARWAREQRLNRALKDLPADQLLAFIEFESVAPAIETTRIRTDRGLTIPDTPTYERVEAHIIRKYGKRIETAQGKGQDQDIPVGVDTKK